MLIGLPRIDFGGAFLSMAGMYACAFVVLLKLPRKPSAGVAAGRSAVGSAAHLVEGLRYVRSSPAMIALIAMNLVVVVFVMPYQTLMPEVAERVFGAGAEGLGWLMAASGAGALTGAIVVASLSRLRRPAVVQVGWRSVSASRLPSFHPGDLFPSPWRCWWLSDFCFRRFRRSTTCC
jgi:Transmembrane secretion effector